MNRVLRPLLIALVCVLIGAFAPLSAFAQGAKPIDPEGLKLLSAATGGAAKVSIHRATGAARFVRLPAFSKSDLVPSAARLLTSEEKAMAFFREYGRVFGIKSPQQELMQVGEDGDQLGFTHLTYQQMYAGIPVFGGILKTHIDRSGRLNAVNGIFIPGIDVSTTPKRTSKQAEATAVAWVSKQNGNAPLTALSTRLVVYRDDLARGVAGKNYLAYDVLVGNGSDIRERVFIDALTGKPIHQVSEIYSALYRKVYDGKNLNGFPPEYPATPWWDEPTGLLPTAENGYVCTAAPAPYNCNTEADNMLYVSGESYNFFYNTFGRDAYDGAGGVYYSIFDYGSTDCPNAWSSGRLCYFCPGLTADDVVGHEWSHSNTTFTQGIFYEWQPGALAEMYADIFGELVDQYNGRGTDTPNTVRTVGACSTHSLTAQLLVNTPPAIAGVKLSQAATFGPQITSDTTGDVVYATPANGCAAITNDVSGKVALIERGVCNFTVKVKNAQLAGAIAAVIANSAPTGLPGMGGTDATITIPSLGISKADGDAIKAQSGVNATLQPKGGIAEDSYRWLVGEDTGTVAGAGAMRDMWTPSCYGDPDKVSDPLYFCDESDRGGVHTNNGVGNHAFTFLVDGGTYNSQTVTGIGQVKAAHIYWRTESVYQNAYSDFSDHADALEASCTDLIGTNLTGFDGNPSGEIINAGDCTQVTAAIAAVELRAEPTQCGFEPILGTTPPSLCAAAVPVYTMLNNDFETDPTATWAVSNEGVNPEWIARNWDWGSGNGYDWASYGWYGIDPGDGDCVTDNQNGVINLDSPSITLPVGANPLLSFDHYVNTEPYMDVGSNFGYAWDGGVLEISTDGGTTWTYVPDAAFTYSPYNRLILDDDPLGGLVGFAGSNPGSIWGSWGTSRVDLSSLATPGQSIRVRWALGTDCAGGREGWYLDNVRVYACGPTVTVDNVTVTEGNTGTVNATFTVTLSEATADDITIDYATAPGTAIAPGDFTATSGTLTITAGNTSGTIVVPVVGDLVRENTETFTLNLSNPTSAIILDAQGVGTITDNDSTIPKLSINNVTAAEGNAGLTPFTFTVTLSAVSGQTVTVKYATANGTAVAGSDYQATSGTLTFSPGDLTKTILVNVNGDTVRERNEGFTVRLSAPTNATIYVGTGRGTITNDD